MRSQHFIDEGNARMLQIELKAIVLFDGHMCDMDERTAEEIDDYLLHQRYFTALLVSNKLDELRALISRMRDEDKGTYEKWLDKFTNEHSKRSDELMKIEWHPGLW